MLRELEQEGFADFECADLNEENFPLDKTQYGFVKADFNEALPFEDSRFDVIISSETIEHVENPRAFMRELHRVLKTDGTLILTTPNVVALSSRLRFALAGALDGHSHSDYEKAGHISILPDWALERMIRELGLEVVSKTYNCCYVPVLSRFHIFRSQRHFLNRSFGWILMYALAKRVGP